MKKFVWLNLATGEFSNSWTESDEKKYQFSTKELADHTKENNPLWKLIEYKCHSDPDFEFYEMMKLQ